MPIGALLFGISFTMAVIVVAVRSSGRFVPGAFIGIKLAVSY
jgi:hypothetical protein